jgi:hypothetical protein
MQNEITVSPLVDILSKQLGEQVVMSGEDFVLLSGFTKVAQSDVDLALLEQALEFKIKLENQTEVAIQNYIDSAAQSLGYDDISSIGKYLGYENPFRIECEKLGLFNAECWTKAFAIKEEVLNGRVINSIDEVIAELPKLV